MAGMRLGQLFYLELYSGISKILESLLTSAVSVPQTVMPFHWSKLISCLLVSRLLAVTDWNRRVS